MKFSDFLKSKGTINLEHKKEELRKKKIHLKKQRKNVLLKNAQQRKKQANLQQKKKQQKKRRVNLLLKSAHLSLQQKRRRVNLLHNNAVRNKILNNVQLKIIIQTQKKVRNHLMKIKYKKKIIFLEHALSHTVRVFYKY